MYIQASESIKEVKSGSHQKQQEQEFRPQWEASSDYYLPLRSTTMMDLRFLNPRPPILSPTFLYCSPSQISWCQLPPGAHSRYYVGLSEAEDVQTTLGNIQIQIQIQIQTQIQIQIVFWKKDLLQGGPWRLQVTVAPHGYYFELWYTPTYI